LRRKLRNIPGTAVTITNPPVIRVGGRNTRSSYQYTLQGLDFAETAGHRQPPGQDDAGRPPLLLALIPTRTRRASLQVDIDRNRAAALGITPDELEGVTGVAFGGQQVSQIYESVDQYQVVLELLPQFQTDASALSRVYLTSKTGDMVPLSAVAHLSRSTMVQSIAHAGQIPAITVSFDLAPGKALSDAVSHVRTATENIAMPATVSRRLCRYGGSVPKLHRPIWAC